MNFGGQTISVVALASSYAIGREVTPPTYIGALSTGAVAGLIHAGVSIPLRQPIFPDQLRDLKLLPPQMYTPAKLVAKSVFGHAALFLVYEGLKEMVERSRHVNLDPIAVPEAKRTGEGRARPAQYDLAWHASNFWAGGIAGLAYRAATVTFESGPVERTWRESAGFLGRTFGRVGLMMYCVELGGMLYGKYA